MSKLIKIKKDLVAWSDSRGNYVVCNALNEWFVLPETETLWLEISATRTRHSYKMEKFKKEGLPYHCFCRVEGEEIEIMLGLDNLLDNISYLRVLYE